MSAIGAFSEDTTSNSATPTSSSKTVVTDIATVTVTPEPEDEDSGHRDEKRQTSDPDPDPASENSTQPNVVAKPKPVRTYLVSRVIDGDTLEVGTGDEVRVVGIDTPERGECGYDSATAALEKLVLGKRVRLGMSDEDHDRYGRLLRYVNIGTMDAGLRQIESGLAVARYDSRDGYGRHQREDRYITADRSSPSKSACPAKSKPQPKAPPEPPGGDCAPGYDPCLPIVADLDCADVDGPINVTGSDPYGLDREKDGVGCES